MPTLAAMRYAGIWIGVAAIRQSGRCCGADRGEICGRMNPLVRQTVYWVVDSLTDLADRLLAPTT
ncbi:hypothetical protein GCM10027610_117430 [Dactylosporangium cerinum]